MITHNRRIILAIDCGLRCRLDHMRWGCRRETSGRSEEGEQKCSRGDQVEYAIDAKAYHEARTEKRPENGAKAKEQDEPPTHCDDLLTAHAVMRVSDRNRVKCDRKPPNKKAVGRTARRFLGK